MKLITLFLTTLGLFAQSQVYINKTFKGVVDSRQSTATFPNQTGLFSAIPTTCGVGQTYTATDRNPSGYKCTVLNTWTQDSSSGGGSSYTLTPATTSNLGGIIVPSSGGLTLDNSGNLIITQASLFSKMGVASLSTNGYLTSADWVTFNNKQPALGFTAQDSSQANTHNEFPLSFSTTDFVRTNNGVALAPSAKVPIPSTGTGVLGIITSGGNPVFLTSPTLLTALFTGCSGSMLLGFDGACHAATSGLADPGANGLLKRTALNTTAPAVAGTDYQDPNVPNTHNAGIGPCASGQYETGNVAGTTPQCAQVQASQVGGLGSAATANTSAFDAAGAAAAVSAADEKLANRGAVNGYASLDSTGKVPSAQLPTISGGGGPFIKTFTSSTSVTVSQSEHGCVAPLWKIYDSNQIPQEVNANLSTSTNGITASWGNSFSGTIRVSCGGSFLANYSQVIAGPNAVVYSGNYGIATPYTFRQIYDSSGNLTFADLVTDMGSFNVTVLESGPVKAVFGSIF